jgi:hypothetical protein
VVVDAEGRVMSRVLVAPAQRLKPGATATFRQSLNGGQARDRALGVSARFGAAGSADGMCTPFCADCDNSKTQRACEQYFELVKRETSDSNVMTQSQLTPRPPDQRLHPTAAAVGYGRE